MQRYLKLAATLRDSSAQARAQEGLGKLAAAGEWCDGRHDMMNYVYLIKHFDCSGLSVKLAQQSHTTPHLNKSVRNVYGTKQLCTNSIKMTHPMIWRALP